MHLQQLKGLQNFVSLSLIPFQLCLNQHRYYVYGHSHTRMYEKSHFTPTPIRGAIGKIWFFSEI